MNQKLDLTIAIPVRNEEKNLAGCLAAIGNDLAQQVVVIDSGSTDKTKEIARQFQAQIVEFNWDGKFPKKRNWYLREHRPITKWVLFLDADEYLTEEFKIDLRKNIINSDKVGYWLDYTIYFMGKKLKGGYPLRKLALFRVGAGEYERIDEEHWSILDMEVHEHPILSGNIGQIKRKIDHRDFRSIEQYINKQREYAKWESSRFINLKSNSHSNLTLKQKIKYKFLISPWIGPLYFIGSFILMGGFRDGSRGLVFALLKMSYFNEIYCRIMELKSTKNAI